VEGQIVAAADAMDIIMTSLRELKLGNQYFDRIFDVGLGMLKKYERFKFAKLFAESAKRYKTRGGEINGQPTFSDEFVT
jgi:hypothetical protein